MSQLKTNAIRHTTATSDAITLASDGTATAKITNNLSNRNIIINGAMNVAQRGTSSTSSDFGLDRWKVQWSGQDEALTHAQHALTSSDTGPWAKGFRNSLHVTNGNQTSGAGAADYANIRYVPEAQDLACSGWDSTSSSSKLTLSFWIRCNVANNVGIYSRLDDSSGDKNFTSETGNLTADTWTYVTKVIPGASHLTINHDNGIGWLMQFIPFYGTDYSDGSAVLDTWKSAGTIKPTTDNWITSNNAYMDITGVQLEVADAATDFEHRTYDQELSACQRYFQVYHDKVGVILRVHSSTQALTHIPLHKQMRDVPTYAIAPSNANFDVLDNGGVLANQGHAWWTWSAGGARQAGWELMGTRSAGTWSDLNTVIHANFQYEYGPSDGHYFATANSEL